mgnify:CR=1 FL=1
MNTKKLRSFLKKLEKEKVITRKPKPTYAFLLAFIYVIILIAVIKTNAPFYLINFTMIMAVFAFIFAILHLIVVRVLES